jgi:hypothetical protein
VAEVGFAGAVLARETPEGLMLIDGHLRSETAGAGIIPVLVLDVTESEADKILATYDPIGAMADSDAAKLDSLLRDVQTGNQALATMLAELAEAAGVIPGADADEPEQADNPEQFEILITLQKEEQQAELLERLTAEGYKCRSLIS